MERKDDICLHICGVVSLLPVVIGGSRPTYREELVSCPETIVPCLAEGNRWHGWVPRKREGEVPRYQEYERGVTVHTQRYA